MSDLTIYTVAWICAIGTELVAAKQFLDETHDAADQLPANDDNAYVLGKVGKHNVVIAALPHGQYGLVSAAIVARDMARSFPNLRFALMVGIGGGAPSQRHDIRLGDIVVSSPGSGVGGVLQYDFGKTIQDESFKVTGHLNQSPQCLLRAIPLLEADYESDGNGIHANVSHHSKKVPFSLLVSKVCPLSLSCKVMVTFRTAPSLLNVSQFFPCREDCKPLVEDLPTFETLHCSG